MKKMYKDIFTEEEAIAFAKEKSESIVIRTHGKYGSDDERRDAIPEEAQQVKNAISAALIAIRNGGDPDTAKATAEFFIILNESIGNEFSHINTYDSVYIPINEFLREMEIEK